MCALTVEEASETYLSGMRNVCPVGVGICSTCKTFIDPDFDRCFACSRQPDWFDAVVPISYSEHLGQLHTALRLYKRSSSSVQQYAAVRLAAILWRFLVRHEYCVAADAAVTTFDAVATVPSSTAARESVSALWTIAGWCEPIRGRLERILAPTDEIPAGRGFDQRRYAVQQQVDGISVLLIDDTWAAGGHAQSAAAALRDAGAANVALVVIGRHVQPGWVVGGKSCGEHLAALPPRFSWDTCAVH